MNDAETDAGVRTLCELLTRAAGGERAHCRHFEQFRDLHDALMLLVRYTHGNGALLLDRTSAIEHEDALAALVPHPVYVKYTFPGEERAQQLASGLARVQEYLVHCPVVDVTTLDPPVRARVQRLLDFVEDVLSAGEDAATAPGPGQQAHSEPRAVVTFHKVRAQCVSACTPCGTGCKPP